MNPGEYFKINSIEELKQVYFMFEGKWRYPLKHEINDFNYGYRYVRYSFIGIYLGSSEIVYANHFIEIPFPININKLNKLI